jgi:hypothetical protein
MNHPGTTAIETRSYQSATHRKIHSTVGDGPLFYAADNLNLRNASSTRRLPLAQPHLQSSCLIESSSNGLHHPQHINTLIDMSAHDCEKLGMNAVVKWGVYMMLHFRT